MALSKFEKDMNIIAPLDNEPNDVGGLSAEQLKAKLDEGNKATQEYINETLTEEIDQTFATREEIQDIALGQIPDNSLPQTKLDSALNSKIDNAIQPDDMVDSNIDLSSDVATALGLDSADDPQVKDGFDRLSGAVNPLQYIWDKYQRNEDISYGDVSEVDLGNVFYDSQDRAYITLQCADNISVSDDEEINLVNPTSITLLFEQFTPNPIGDTETLLNSKYFIINNTCYSGDNTVAIRKLDPNHVFKNASKVTASVTFDYLDEVISYAPDAYPQNGYKDNFKYIYTGRPKYIEMQIETGSYTGTGTYGSDNPNSLTFGFVPKIVMVYAAYGILYESEKAFIWATGLTRQQGDNSQNNIFFVQSANQLSWVNSNYAAPQLNLSGKTYYYTAIG